MSLLSVVPTSDIMDLGLKALDTYGLFGGLAFLVAVAAIQYFKNESKRIDLEVSKAERQKESTDNLQKILGSIEQMQRQLDKRTEEIDYSINSWSEAINNRLDEMVKSILALEDSVDEVPEGILELKGKIEELLRSGTTLKEDHVEVKTMLREMFRDVNRRP